MKTRLIWEKCRENDYKDSFWIECTNNELEVEIRPRILTPAILEQIDKNSGPSKINPNRNEDIYCHFFLVSTDLKEIKSFPWVFPHSGLWGEGNPFEEIQVIEFQKLEELKSIYHRVKKIKRKLSPRKVLFIKLGKGGADSQDCINNNYMKLYYKKVDHNLCSQGKWNEVYDYYINEKGDSKGVATNHTNQIKQFYESDEETLWITFHANKLWWCYAKQEIIVQNDNSKIRQVIGKWSDRDLKNEELLYSNLSGKLIKTHGFQGTICNVSAKDYVISKINAEPNQEVVDVQLAFNNLKQRLIKLIEHLQWQDLEILVDLIFRQMGWQRVSVLGENLKTIDLELFSPITNERAIVQIKSGADLKSFKEYERRFEDFVDYNKLFYIASAPSDDLVSYKETHKETNLTIYFADKLSELAISSGLVEWVIRKYA